jgi:hypothetical protein
VIEVAAVDRGLELEIGARLKAIGEAGEIAVEVVDVHRQRRRAGLARGIAAVVQLQGVGAEAQP